MKKIIKLDELEKCSCFNLRTMARDLTNDYNKSLKNKKITATQIPILAILNIYEQLETKKISKLLNLEISTIRRNLITLKKKRLVKIIKRNSNGNILSLTSNGFLKLKESLPVWRESNKKARKSVRSFLKVLKSITE
tara:strand:- start:8780 stop:9190 length:411 start_codon:yes stop_codon:yes gene_type:complete